MMMNQRFYVYLCSAENGLSVDYCVYKLQNTYIEPNSSLLGPFKTEDEALNAWMLLGRSALLRIRK